MSEEQIEEERLKKAIDEIKTNILNNISMAKTAIEEEKNLLSLETRPAFLIKRRTTIEEWRGYLRALERVLEDINALLGEKEK